jgi:hypothetical protein
MTIDRKDWNVRQAQALGSAARNANLRALERLRQAAVPAEKLMGDDHWRIYQQMLQDAVNRQIENRDRLVLQLMSDTCNSYEDMVRVKRMIAECEATIRAWQTAIDLPKQLLNGAAEAQQALNDVTDSFAEKPTTEHAN